MSGQDERDEIVTDMIPENFDAGLYPQAVRMRELMRGAPGVTITGSGTSADTADFSYACAEGTFWVFVKRVEARQ